VPNVRVQWAATVRQNMTNQRRRLHCNALLGGAGNLQSRLSGFRAWRPRTHPLAQRYDLSEVICAVDCHTIEFIGQCHARLDLGRQPLGLKPQRCGSASTLQEQGHQIVPLALMLWRRARVEFAVRVTRCEDTLLVSHKVPEFFVDRVRCALGPQGDLLEQQARQQMSSLRKLADEKQMFEFIHYTFTTFGVLVTAALLAAQRSRSVSRRLSDKRQ